MLDEDEFAAFVSPPHKTFAEVRHEHPELHLCTSWGRRRFRRLRRFSVASTALGPGRCFAR